MAGIDEPRTPRPPAPDDVATYASALADRLAVAAPSPVIGVYLVGSSALGGDRTGASDVDVLAVLADAPPTDGRQRIVDAVSHPALPCPARGLELQIYDAASVATARPDGAFLVNLNSGPAMTTSVSFDPATEPAHWFVVDRAIAHRHGVMVRGPSAATVIAPTPRALVLDALGESVAWHGSGDPLGANSVLNACRALRFVVDDTFVSKEDAAAWAIGEGIEPLLVRAALGRRVGDDVDEPLPARDVDALLTRTAVAIDGARR